ncbi:uncharacterized protein LOC144314246 isoform X1 [Canis aureus]
MTPAEVELQGRRLRPRCRVAQGLSVCLHLQTHQAVPAGKQAEGGRRPRDEPAADGLHTAPGAHRAVSSIPAVLHPEVGSNRCYCVLGPRAAEEGGRWGPTLGTSIRRPGGAGPPRPSPFSDLVPSSWSEVPPAPPSCSPWGQSRSPTLLCPWRRSPSPARLCPWGRSPIPACLCPWGRSPSPAFLYLQRRSTSPTRLCPRGQSPSSRVPPGQRSWFPGSGLRGPGCPLPRRCRTDGGGSRPAQKLLSPRPPPPRPAGKGGTRCPQ